LQDNFRRKRLRFVIARMNHETNTFSPLQTPLESFSPRWDGEARSAAEGSRTAMGAFLDFAKARGAETVTPLYATANPSGPVSDSAFEQMSEAIVAAVKKGADAILLDLHGAMVTETLDDGEGELLARIRKIAPETPIGVALDLHGNITPRMIDCADILVSFKTYPHVDMYETGEHVVRIMARMLDEGLKPKRALAHPPVLAQTLRMNTTVPGTMADMIAATQEAEKRSGVEAASLFGGFPLSDLPEAGMSVLVVADTQKIADEVATELADTVWRERAGFVYREQPLADSVAAAARAADGPGTGPVVMLDHGDNCMSGGTCDTMDVLAESLRQGLTGILAGPIADPVAVKEMRAAGIGAAIRLGVGNRMALPGIGVDKAPLDLTGKVRALGRGAYVISGPTYTGMRCDMGEAAVLETDQALVLVVEEPHEPWDFGVFTCVGLDPLKSRFLILKSRMYCRPVFEPIAKAVVECASLGVTSSNLNLFTFGKLSRPIFPLDEQTTWTPHAHLA
jgi:microcystin degradation protein MlrC